MFFDTVKQGPPDAIFGKLGIFNADKRVEKINLMVGIFKDEALMSELLPSVREAKERVLPRDQLANYLTFEGLPEFLGCLGSLVFGKGWDAGRIYAAQSLGGTGALRVGADFLAQEVGRRVYVPQPTWGNHRNIFERAGFGVESIPYYCEAKHGFDGEGYLARLGALEPKSIVVFHAACHNPTGSDPTFEEWKKISAICKERSLLPFFDFAYQGFGDGLEEDARVVRYFLEQGHEMLVAYSCSKNFSLYSQRIGALFVICKDGQARERVGSQVNRIIRAMYSNPPAHGARIVAEILTSGDLCAAWKKEVDLMRRRIVAAHKGLFDLLIAKSKSRDFSFLKGRKGMFTYLDLSKAEVQALIEQHGVYTLDNGRISVAGLTPANTPIVAEKIIAVCK